MSPDTPSPSRPLSPANTNTTPPAQRTNQPQRHRRDSCDVTTSYHVTPTPPTSAQPDKTAAMFSWWRWRSTASDDKTRPGMGLSAIDPGGVTAVGEHRTRRARKALPLLLPQICYESVTVRRYSACPGVSRICTHDSTAVRHKPRSCTSTIAALYNIVVQ